MASSKTREIKYFKHSVSFFAYLFVVWGFYRLLFQFPEPLEELIVKPIVWLVPLYILVKREKLNLNSLGIQFSNLFSVIYFVLALGFVFSLFGFLVNYLKYSGINFSAYIGQAGFAGSLLLSFFTATSEEIAFRGYIFTRFLKYVKNEWQANIVTSIGWSMIHLPIAIFDWRLEPGALLIYMLMAFSYSIGVTFVFIRSKSIVAPILLHVLWQWPIILFR